jgi:hypothetical protein
VQSEVWTLESKARDPGKIMASNQRNNENIGRTNGGLTKGSTMPPKLQRTENWSASGDTYTAFGKCRHRAGMQRHPKGHL